MANFANLKAAINAVIKANGQREITGEVMNQVLTAMVNSLGSNYQFAGVATPSTNPGTPDQNVFYMATQAGTYTNFSAIVLQAGISILLWDGSWSSETFFTVDSVPTSGSNNFITSGAVFDKFLLDGGAYDVTAHNNNATFADLSALLNSENLNTLIPVTVRHGGMSIKFVQSSDNKYVQCRLTSKNWSVNVNEWVEEDSIVVAPNNNSDLSFCDDRGNVIIKSKNGHIQTKNFDSAQVVTDLNSAKTKLATIEEGAEVNDVETEDGNISADLAFTDPNSNMLVEFKGGNIRTKNFDSRDIKAKKDSNDSKDFELADGQDNVILRLRKGQIETKNFKSKNLPANTKEELGIINRNITNLNLFIGNKSVMVFRSVARNVAPVSPVTDDYYFNIANGSFFRYNGSSFVNVNSVILPIVNTLLFKNDEDGRIYEYTNGTMVSFVSPSPRVTFDRDSTLYDPTEDLADSNITSRTAFMTTLYDKFDTLLLSPVTGKNSKLTVTKTDVVEFINANVETEDELEYPEYTQGVTDYHEGDGYVPAYTTPIYKISNEQTTVGYNRENKKHKILLISGNHGMERQAQFDTYLFAKNLLTNYNTNQNLYNILATFDIYILPILNGYGSYMGWRYNANGVNINRNFGVAGWTQGGEPYGRDYSGATPDSEFETKIVLRLCNILSPDIAIDHHSYGSDENTQCYLVGGSLEYSRLAFRVACELGRMLSSNYSTYFGSNLWLPTNQSDIVVKNDNSGTMAQWFFEHNSLIRLGGTVEVSDAINYNNGEYNAQGIGEYGVDECKIAEFTLRTFLTKAVEFVINNSN